MRRTGEQRWGTCLYERHPIAVKDALAQKVFDLLGEGGVHGGGLRGDLCDEGVRLLLLDAFLEKDLCGLCEDEADEELDDVAAEVGGGGVEKVLVDVGEHAGAGAEVVEGELEAVWIGAVLCCGDGGVGCGDLEEDGGLFVGDGCLGGELVGEGVVPGKVDADLGEAELEELELAKVLVEEVAGGHVAARALDGILSAALEGLALLRVCLGVLAVRLCDERADRRRPVHLVRRLFRHRHHRRLHPAC